MARRQPRTMRYDGDISRLAVNRILYYSCLHLLLVLGAHSQDVFLEFSQIEEQDAGRPVGSVSSSPAVLELTGHKARSDLRYSILPDGNDNSNLFKIDAVDGNITFARRVDREHVCPLSRVCDFSFGVAVSGSNNLFTRIPVKVTILDLNDNSPVFQEPAKVEIRIGEDAPENVTRALPVASDADSSVKFGINSYSIEPASDTFRLDISRNLLGISRVSLVLSRKLDRETTNGYHLVVVARDGGRPPRSAVVNVNVIVEDINDNQPHFTQTVYSVNITEDARMGDNILTVSASDADMRDNGRVVYSLTSLRSGNDGEIVDKISIDSSTGVVTLVQPLVNGEYKFWVDAHDLGSPRRYDQALVSLTVLDTINNPPIVRVNPVQKDGLPLGWLPEGLELNTVVAVVSADDPDSGNNGEVSCHSQGPHFLLESLEPKRFKLMIARTLDREANATYTARVTCQDEGQPGLTVTTSLTLTLVDVNDNPPQFARESFVYSIVENNMPGDTVAIVTASDKDESQNAVIVYTLVNAGDDFSVAPNTGIITANHRLDRERLAQYTFQVVAADHGQPALTATATVTINILDLNDNDPMFSMPEYHLRLYENKDPGSAVGNISITDADLGAEGSISLALKPMNETDVVPFAIDHLGRLSSLQKFDRESRNVYQYLVVATDSGSQKRTSSAKVVVDILDINDNAPVFVFPNERNYSTTLNMPVLKDAVILQVDVYDADDNQNGRVIHSIVDNNASQLFTIEEFTGRLMPRMDLNSASMAGVYYLTIKATDRGSPPLWQTRTLQLTLHSESISSDDVMADENLLIVACIVCVTVLVAVVVLVAICVVQSRDRSKRIHYHASACRELAVECNTRLTSPSAPQCSLETSKTSQEPPPPDPAPSHQQRQNHHQPNDSNRNYTANTPTDRLGPRVEALDRNRKMVVYSTQKLQGSGASRHGHDDFNSTASTETGTGDSGHGSDEDVPCSLQQDGFGPALDKYGVSLPTMRSQDRESIPDNTQRPPSQQGSLQTSALKTSRLRANSCSVRFDPRVTDIYDHRHPLRSQIHVAPIRGRSSSVPCSALPRHQSHTEELLQQRVPHIACVKSHKGELLGQRVPQVACLQSHTGELLEQRVPQIACLQQGRYGQSQVTRSYQPDNNKARRYLYPGERPSLPSLSSLGDSCTEDSDLNTTTSGSYSVVSDTRLHGQGPGVPRLADWNV
ncbi:hypothetical protein BsWGS_17986 [Bradybaena similaris]